DKLTPRSKRLARLEVQGLEDRTLLSTAPPVQVLGFERQTIASGTYNQIWPVVAVDPADPNKMAAIELDHRFDDPALGEVTNAQLLYSINGGSSWLSGGQIFRDINPSTLGGTPVPFQFTSDPSVGFDRNHNLYVLVRESTGTADGALILNKFDFSGSSPVDQFLDNRIYQWDGSRDPAYSPTLAVDGNASSFTDTE